MHPAIAPLRATVLAALLAGACTACTASSDKDPGTASDTEVTTADCEGTELTDVDGSATGYVSCADGGINKADAASCSLESHETTTCAGSEDSLNCESDADCTGGPNGVCASSISNEPWDTGSRSYCSCVYRCETDDDCGSGQVCACADVNDGIPYPQCIDAGCTTGEDCEGGECGVSSHFDGCDWHIETACRTDEDVCRDDGDCSDGDCAQAPYDSEDESWSCQTQSCDIGRPLRIEAEARTAPAVPRADWLAEALPLTAGAERAQAAAAWRSIAALEHASVASFARFTLQLMALGAPPELLEQVQAASSDEIRHAKLAYSIASALSHAAVGPGPLSLEGLALPTDARAVARALVVEACVGETLGAAEAWAAARDADPVLRPHLERLAEDEERHAALAWRSLGWLLANIAPELAGEVRGWVQAELDRMDAALAEDADPGVPHLGLPSSRTRRALHHQVVDGVLRPALDSWEGRRAA